MDEALPLVEIKNRVVKAFLSLTLRQVLLQAIGFISINIILAKILPVATLGVFNIAQSIIAFFAFFSDIGLAGALIQKKETVTQDDIKTTFTIQFIIVAILSLIIIVSSPWISSYYKLDESGTWLIRILGLGFFLTSLKVVPIVLSERHLKFQPIVTVEVVETLVFNALLIYLSFQSYGLWAFSAAALTRGIIGVTMVYILIPTKIGFGINKLSAKKLLTFGVPYQLNSLLALLKDRLLPLVVAGMVGPLGMGYITWAQSMAFIPLMTVGSVTRVMFPAFSRLQHDKEALTRAVEKSLFFTTLVAYPTIFGLGAILPSFASIMFGSKYFLSIPSFYLFSISVYWSVMSLSLSSLLTATGYVKKTLQLMMMWTTLEWLITPFLTYQLGIVGVGLASALISFASVVTIIIVKRIIPVRIIYSIAFPTLASALMAFLVFAICKLFVKDFLSLGIAIILGGLIYILLVLLFEKNRVLSEIKNIRHV